MNVLFVAGFSPITPDPAASRALYLDQIGLPLEQVQGDYWATESVDGAKHLGIWPLSDAAQSCFGTDDWPTDVPIPQATLELEVDDVEGAASELEAAGHTLIHGARTEPWGQTIARLLSPEGLLIGLANTPHLHE
jgi:catechol 2,3-dioxygenase-like lactoylglutathione lyase family enzyme